MYLGFVHPVSTGEFEARAYGFFYERNPQGNGNGNHDSAVETIAYGLELACRDVPLPVERLSIDTYGSVWSMRNRADVADGEIWFTANGDTGEDMWGFSVGVKWNDPVGFTRNRRSYLSFQYNHFFIDEPASIIAGLNNDESVFNIALGLNF